MPQDGQEKFPLKVQENEVWVVTAVYYIGNDPNVYPAPLHGLHEHAMAYAEFVILVDS